MMGCCSDQFRDISSVGAAILSASWQTIGYHILHAGISYGYRYTVKGASSIKRGPCNASIFTVNVKYSFIA